MLERDRAIVEPLLEPGELLVEAAPVDLAPGVPQPPAELLTPRRPSALEQRIAAPFGVLRKAYAVFNPVGAAVGAVEDRLQDAVPDSLVHGQGLAGGWAGSAGQLVVGMHEAGARSGGLLALTDRRLVLLADRAKLWQLTPEHVVHWSAPYHRLAALRRHPKGVLQRGRLDLHFPDGSWLGLVTPRPAAAEELAAAFAHHRG
ncbi:hypothetical protein CFP65_1667 [Kitasatospora sp. MMS16-BH015]|uniref:hypothetical protein n=1 Tax=Kitasatospora sp. MMS16-BH015 TaxID=2018025 RepID=UPI000CA09F31|nr:hypothetical protein [Kitasatospora sp. MMS16-BH015]AUG76550.1 hypothetical protein CFP65_1667 [Kitasatospora sp. MMS16-BH015]